MADAQATFVISLDASPLQAGARKAGSSLEQMAARIRAGNDRLKALRDSMKRLEGGVSVKRYQAIPKELEAAAKESQKLESKLKPLRENIDIAKQANVRPEDMQKLVEAAAPLEAQLAGVQGRIERLNGEMEGLVGNAEKGLEGDAAVQAFKDQEAVVKQLEGELVDLETEYLSAGGSAEDLAKRVEEPKAGLEGLLDTVKGAGGPLGGLAGKFEQLKAAGPAAAILAIAVAIIAVVTAAVRAAVDLTKFALASADAARSAGLLKQAAAWGDSKGVEDITSAVAKLRAETGATKDEATKLATELYRSGLRGKGLENAALTMERFGVLGEEVKGQVKGLYEQLRQPLPMGAGAGRGFVVTKDMLPRDVFLRLAAKLGKDGSRALAQGMMAGREQIANALQGLASEGGIADVARAQGLALSKQLERLRENWDSLFAGLKIDGLLGALSKVTALLDENSATGKALRKILATVFQPLADGASKLMPIVEGFFQGVTAAALLFLIVALKIRNTVRKLLPTDALQNIDLAEVAFYAGAFAIGVFVTALGLLAAVLASVAIGFAILTAPIWLPFVLAAAAVIAMWIGLKKLQGAFDKGVWKSAGDNIISGLVEGIAAGASIVVDAVKDLASKALGAFKDFNIIRSPAKRWRIEGRRLPEGTALGIEDGTPDVEDAAANMVAPPSPEAMGGAGGGPGARGAAMTVRVEGGLHVHVHAPNLTQAAELQDESFLRQLARALASMVASAGAAPAEVTA